MNSASAETQNPKQNNIADTHKKLLIYYSHPIKTYGTAKEIRSLKLLEYKFSKFTIINPKDYRFTGMREYLELEAQCSIFAYHNSLNGRITKGVALERLLAFMIGIPIYRIGSRITKESIHVISYSEGILSDHDYAMVNQILEGLP